MPKPEITIVKSGGKLIDDSSLLEVFLDQYSKIETPKILIHGGGNIGSQTLAQMGIPVKMIEGRRVTDRQSLNILTGIYCGQINKFLVSNLNGKNSLSLGLSGADAQCVLSKKRQGWDHDYGYVGDVVSVNEYILSDLLKVIPSLVFSSITQDKNGQLLNTNADTMATEIAVAMQELYSVTLLYCFELNGVLKNFEDKNSVVSILDKTILGELKEAKKISDGMLPKLKNCFYAKSQGIKKVKIGNGSHLNELLCGPQGTTIV